MPSAFRVQDRWDDVERMPRAYQIPAIHLCKVTWSPVTESQTLLQEPLHLVRSWGNGWIWAITKAWPEGVNDRGVETQPQKDSGCNLSVERLVMPSSSPLGSSLAPFCLLDHIGPTNAFKQWDLDRMAAFTIYKFWVPSETSMDWLVKGPSANEDRLTQLGKRLRATSLDELPWALSTYW